MGKWIVSKHTNDLNTIIRVLELIREMDYCIDKKSQLKIRAVLEEEDLYNPRSGTAPDSTHTIQAKISSLKYWMFGYVKRGQKATFHLSTTAMKLLDENDNDKRKELFLKLALSVQYPHYHNRTPKSVNIYPLRLIFKLLLDSKLDMKLHEVEYALFISKITHIDESKYNEIVDEIIEFREKRNSDPKLTYEDGLAAYEFTYLYNTFVKMEYFEHYEGKTIDNFTHKKNKNNKSGSTTRQIRDSYVKISNQRRIQIEKMCQEYNFYEKPKAITVYNIDEFYKNI